MKQTKEQLFVRIEEYAQQIQRMYFDNERFFDSINADYLDNITGWLYEPRCAVIGWINGEEAAEQIKGLYDNFANLAKDMEKQGGGANGMARGIKHEVQYVWAVSSMCANYLKEIAEQMKIKL